MQLNGFAAPSLSAIVCKTLAMKGAIAAVLLFAATGASALDVSHLSDDIQSAIASKEAAIEAGRKRQKYDFVGDFRLSGSATQSKTVGAGDWSGSEQIGASFSQDIFRSGGIIASIDYAELSALSARLQLIQERNGHLQSLATLLLQSKQDEIRLRQNELNAKNAEIALLIKQRQYEAGEADITQLNDALQTKNNLRKTRLDLENQRLSRLEDIAKLTPLKPEAIPLAPFEQIDQGEFVENSISAKLAKVQSQSAKVQQTITVSSYLPSISASAGVSRSYADTGDRESYNYGLSLSMPISLTEGWAIEEKKLEALRAQSQERTTIEEVKRAYAQSKSAIETTQKNVEVSKENIALYDSLINVTRAQAQSGSVSLFDLQTLENSRESDRLEIESNQIAVQIELAKLYYAIDKEIK
ncbi:MAG: TolC family protein [Helicobacteraceae bacterium]|jgi:outer membrane protein TolC|nr:TolC family protein [Helicobacteraceae bacterium]